MSRADTWMPLYIGDYLGDTMALEAREHGAYLLLIMHYWRNGPLPDDDRALAGIARVDRAIWLADTGPIVRAFFTARDGKLFHKRIDRERENAQTVSDTKRAAAQTRWGKDRKPKVNGSGEPGATPAGGPAGDAYASEENVRQSNPNGEYHASAMHMHQAPDHTVNEGCSSYAYASDVHVGCISPSPSQVQEEKEGKKASRASRASPAPLPDPWRPSSALVQFAGRLGLSVLAVDAAADRMRDWAKGGGVRKADWDAVFRNWLRGDAVRAAKPQMSVYDTIRRDGNLPTFLTPVFDDFDGPAPFGLRTLQ